MHDCGGTSMAEGAKVWVGDVYAMFVDFELLVMTTAKLCEIYFLCCDEDCWTVWHGVQNTCGISMRCVCFLSVGGLICNS